MPSPPVSGPLREFLEAEWPGDESRASFDSELAAIAQLQTEMDSKLAEADFVEAETLRKLQVAPDRSYSLAEYMAFLRDLQQARVVRAEVADIAAQRRVRLATLLSAEEASVALCEKFIRQNAPVAKK